MKLAMCYTVFNGEELLVKSVMNHIDLVDEIIICFQQVSNKRNSNPGLLAVLAQLSANKKINFVEFRPNFNVGYKENERIKHNLMVESARNSGATHFILSACDHFYKSDEFLEAKKTAETGNFDATFTPIFTYYKHFTWQITPIESYYMPFICKLYENTRIERVNVFPVLVDPSVQMNTCKISYLFIEDEIMLHHYSMCRNDIKSKFDDAILNPKSVNNIPNYIAEYENATLESKISYFGNRSLKEVKNYFNL